MTLTPQDRFDILDLIARYNRAADDRDVEGTLAVYSDDGAIEGDFQAGPGSSFRDALMAIFESEGTLKRHVSVNHAFHEVADGVAVQSLLVVVEGESAPAVVATATVRDQFRREQGLWKLHRHHVQIDPSLRATL